MSKGLDVTFLIFAGEVAIAVGQAYGIRYVRQSRARIREARAEVDRKRRELENPPIPAHVFECLGELIRGTEKMSGGRRLAGQNLADTMRLTTKAPDAVLAACVHEVLFMADSVVSTTPERMRFRLLCDVLVAAARELCWLELDPAGHGHDH